MNRFASDLGIAQGQDSTGITGAITCHPQRIVFNETGNREPFQIGFLLL
jgi:hypothetical protein